MKWLPRPKFIYVSPWLLAAATGLLVLIVVTFAVSNISREKRLMTNAMLQKAATLNRFISSGAKASYISDLQHGIWKPDPWQAHVQRIINHLSDDPDLSFIAVINGKGKILAHSIPEKCGTRFSLKLPVDLARRTMQGRYVYTVIPQKKQERFLEVIRAYTPFQPVLPGIPLSMQELHKRFTLPFALESLLTAPDEYYLIIGLDMKSYDKALDRLRFQVFMLSLAMLLVGIGGWLSLAAVQGYRVSRKALQEIQAFTGLLISKLPVGIIATNTEGRITTWNNAVSQLLNLSASQAIGKKPEDILPAELALFFSGKVECKKVEKEQGGCEIRLAMPEGEIVLSCHHLRIADTKQHPEGEVLLVSNMTALKNLEKEMRETERLAAVGRMAAGVAHEVRNPLSSVKGLALLLQRKFAEKSNEHETATLLIQEVERINRTISELLSFARPAPLELTKVDIRQLLERQIKLLAADRASDGIRFVLEASDDLCPLAADQDRLNQVFVNILLNGVQAMGDGGELVVRAVNNSEDDSVVISVADSGIGMEKDTVSQVFFPYFTTKKGGTGVGLALSQKIVNEHGGTIKIHSSPGRGTVVTVTLPIWKEE